MMHANFIIGTMSRAIRRGEGDSLFEALQMRLEGRSDEEQRFILRELDKVDPTYSKRFDRYLRATSPTQAAPPSVQEESVNAEEMSFETFQEMIRENSEVLAEDPALRNGILNCRTDAEGINYLQTHFDEFSPEVRDILVEGFLSRIEDASEKEKLLEEGGKLFDLAMSDVLAFREQVGVETISRSNPRMICGFLNEHLNRTHDVDTIRAVLKSLRIPCQIE